MFGERWKHLCPNNQKALKHWDITFTSANALFTSHYFLSKSTFTHGAMKNLLDFSLWWETGWVLTQVEDSGQLVSSVVFTHMLTKIVLAASFSDVIYQRKCTGSPEGYMWQRLMHQVRSRAIQMKSTIKWDSLCLGGPLALGGLIPNRQVSVPVSQHQDSLEASWYSQSSQTALRQPEQATSVSERAQPRLLG